MPAVDLLLKEKSLKKSEDEASQPVSILTLRNRRNFQLADYHDLQLNEISLLVQKANYRVLILMMKYAEKVRGAVPESFGLFHHQNPHLTFFFLHQERDLVEQCIMIVG